MPSFLFQLTHNEYTFVSVIMMIQSGAIWAYMRSVRVKTESRSSFFLRMTFALIFWQAVILFIINGISGGQAFLPFHYASLVAVGIPLMKFIHYTPRHTTELMDKLGIGIVILIFLFVSGYAVYFAYQYIYHWQPGLSVDSSFWPLLPISLVFFIIGIWYRVIRFTPQPSAPLSKMAYLKMVINSLLFPPTPGTQALRDIALVLLLVALITSFIFFNLSHSTLLFLVMSAALFAMLIIALVYINHSPEPTSFIVKLVGISLFALLTISGWLGLRNIGSLRAMVDNQRMIHAELVHQGMQADNLRLLPPDVLYVVAWPKGVENGARMEQAYLLHENMTIEQLVLANQLYAKHLLDVGIETKTEDLLYDALDQVVKKNVNRYLFNLAGTTYEVGFSADQFQEEMNQEVNALLLVVMVSSGALILLLPLFFRTNLVTPLNDLLAGVQRANAGDLDVTVNMRYRDEIGFLTNSFNGMIQSLAESAKTRNKLNAALQKSNETLELRVQERTIELAQAVDLAERANRAKSVFLATMTHELRTPLNGILGYTQILQRNRSTTNKQQDGLSIIEHSGKHLLTLINDVLDLAKIESGKVELLESDFHLPIFLSSIAELIRVRAEQKGMAFDLQLSEAFPTRVCTDERRLRQVLLNLLGNAVKFTSEGSVTLRVEVVGDDLLQFAILDTGPGIASSEIEHIFNPFSQANQEDQVKGTGLGLPISRHLVQLLGGELQVTSQVGVGSQFSFELILPVVEYGTTSHIMKQKKPMRDGTWGSGYKILVVDDNLNNRGVIRDLLSPLGFEIIEAQNGQKGLTVAIKDKPDLIITDLVMPDMDGFELIQQIRQSEHSKLLIIATSASVYEEDHQKSIALGADAFVHKPIDADLLLCEVARLLSLESQALHLNLTSPSSTVVRLPDQKVLELLLELALLGDVAALRSKLSDLSQQDEAFMPFVSQMQSLLQAFKLNQICKLLEGYLE